MLCGHQIIQTINQHPQASWLNYYVFIDMVISEFNREKNWWNCLHEMFDVLKFAEPSENNTIDIKPSTWKMPRQNWIPHFRMDEDRIYTNSNRNHKIETTKFQCGNTNMRENFAVLAREWLLLNQSLITNYLLICYMAHSRKLVLFLIQRTLSSYKCTHTHTHAYTQNPRLHNWIVSSCAIKIHSAALFYDKRAHILSVYTDTGYTFWSSRFFAVNNWQIFSSLLSRSLARLRAEKNADRLKWNFLWLFIFQSKRRNKP